MKARVGPLARPALVGLIVLTALVPLFNFNLPRSADGRNHLFRAVELDRLIRNGVLYPRFAPDLAYGYGYPLFNYYAPLTYYVMAGLHWLGLDWASALMLTLALAVIVGAWGVFKLTQEWFGSLTGAGLAAAVYAFGPYTLFNVITRAAVPEALAVALLPWLVWSLHRALTQPTALSLVRLALLYAVTLFTHNLTALIATALLGIGWLVETALSFKSASQLAIRNSLIALILGLALGAYFWLPAFFEQSAVQVSQLTAPATLDFRNYFLSLQELLSPPYVFDPLLENQPVPVALGWPQAVGGLFGIVMLWRYRDARTRGRVAVIGALFLIFVALTVRASLPVWEAIGPLRLMQFPWRFLGPATVLAALLAGAGVSALNVEARRWLRVVPVVAVATTALYALPWTYVLRYPMFPANPSLDDLFAYEVESGSLGLTSTGEFLPADVKQLPPADGLRSRYAVSPVIDRLDTEGLPPSASVTHSRSGLLLAEAAFSSDQPFDVTFLWFHFPGWHAEVDGQRVNIRPTDPHGLISVPVPAGEHTVRVSFGTTPLRQWAGGISVAGVIGLLLVAWKFQTSPSPPAPLPEGEGPGVRASSMLLIALALTGLLFGLARAWFDERDNPFRYSRYDGQTISGVAETLDVNFGGKLNLIGFDPPDSAPADGRVRFTLYWRLYEPVDENYSVSAQLWDAEGHLVGQQDVWEMGGHPTTRWLPGNYGVTRFAFTPYPGTPPGAYRLMISAYPGKREPVNVLNLDGNPIGRSLETAQVVLAEPTRPPTDAELTPALRLNAPLGPLTLVGVDVPVTQAASGDVLPLVFYWRSLTPNPSARVARLELVSANGALTSLGVFSPARDDYPTSAWPPGAGVRAPHDFLIPPSVPAGKAELRLSLEGESSAFVSLGVIEVTVPARAFDVPPIESPLEAQFGPGIKLLGYRASVDSLRAGQPLALTLYWQSAQTVTTRYKVFVQLLNTDRQIIAQADAVPGQGARPTTGWLPPEVITDDYVLTLPGDTPAGVYNLEIGLYDPQTGARVDVLGVNGQTLGDHVVLRTIRLP